MKRYQVFISSTYTDLREERAAVLKSILRLNCFPAGMELFPSASVEQFEYIKKLIEESDYYVLVIGARYGDDREGISFTEKEFDYAVSKNIPVLAFIHEHPEEIPAKFYELDNTKRLKLEKFKEKVKKDRLVNFWNDPNELASQVVFSLEYAIKTIPRQGWEPALSESNIKIYNDNLSLRSEIEKYRNNIKELKTSLSYYQSIELNDINDYILLSGTYENDSVCENKHTFNISFKKIFILWYPHILDVKIDIQAKHSLDKAIENHLNLNKFNLDEDCYNSIKIHLSKMGIIAEFSKKNHVGFSKQIVVTEYGKLIWNSLN